MANNDPVELNSSYLYNFKIENKKFLNDKAEFKDLDILKQELVSSIKKSITSEESDKGIKQKIITQVKLFVVFEDKVPVTAFLQRDLAEDFTKSRSISFKEYAIKKIEDSVKIIGEPPLSESQENILFSAISKEIASAGPFDALGDFGKVSENIMRSKSQENSDIGDLGKVINKNVRK